MKLCVLSLALALSLLLCGCSGGAASAPAALGTPAGTMPAQDVSTLDVGAVIVARDDVPEDQIYDLLAILFEDQETLARKNPLVASLSLNYAASVTDVPYHPGAAKYYREQGCEVEAKEVEHFGPRSNLSMGTGNSGGNYYALGNVLSEHISAVADFTITTVPSGGSKANLEALEAEEVQLCFVQADVMSYAHEGRRLFEKPMTDFSVVAALYTEQLQILTNDPAITTVEDLRDKRVAIGVSGSGVYYNSLDVLNAYGMTERDINSVNQAFGDSAESLKKGTIDATFVLAGVPTPAVAALAGESSISMVSMDQEHIQTLIGSNPYYSAGVIRACTY